MKHHEINLEDLQKWLQDESVTFASSARENKKLVYNLTGYLEVIVGNAIVWRGNHPELAVKKYNSIAEKYVNPLKDFKV